MASANSSIAAVAYYRMSSDQQDASIPAQKKAVERYATEHGYSILRVYQDDGIAGWKEEREAFQRLISDLERGDFQAVLCWDQNRFSRFPVLEANHYWYLLDRAGCHLATVNQGRLDWHSIAGWITASIKQHGDAQHRFQLSADVKRGKRAVAERGEWQGKPPYGYAIENKRLVPGSSQEVAVVRRIFQEYVEGRSLRAIACQLNSDGIIGSFGHYWSSATMQYKLKNPTYIGTYRGHGIELQNNHPAIVDRATFETVQRLLRERKSSTTPKQNGGGFLFSGLLRCGKCGSAMTGGTTGNYKHYTCRGSQQKGAAFCELNIVKQAELVEHVIGAMEQRFLNPKVVQRLREELRRQVSRETRKTPPDTIRKDLTAVEAKLAKAKRRLVECDTDMLPVVQQAIRDLRGECERLGTALEAAQTSPDALFEAVDAKVDKAMSLFGSLRETLRQADTLRLRELLRETIDTVHVWTDKRTEGRSQRFKLERGIVVVRSNNLFNSPDPSSPELGALAQTASEPLWSLNRV